MESHGLEKHPVKSCHVCQGARFYYLFSVAEHRVVRCVDCGLLFFHPQPGDAELSRIYHDTYFLGSDTESGRETLGAIKHATARLYLEEIQRYRGGQPGRLLEVGCGDGDFLVEAEIQGWEVSGIEYSAAASERAQGRLRNGMVWPGEMVPGRLPAEHFDLCVISDVIEHVRSPLALLAELHRVLKPEGVLFIATPSTDSWSARLMRQRWMEFKPEHLTYFDRQTLQTALFRTGFRGIIVAPGWKILSFDYIRMHFVRFPVAGLTPALNFLSHVLPAESKSRHRRIVASGMIVMGHKAPLREVPVLSVIVPAYNEAATFDRLMASLLRKELPGLRLELIVVESNSDDGTRELALQYRDRGVKVILEEQPRGKGHAVRRGLKEATGDYILIQDADLEYDLEDYDGLLEPLLAGRAAFVLGSRHGGHNVWKMRQFTGQRGLSLFINSGHWFFSTLINVLFFLRLRDPFTMFKVFRRDCLYALEFECDRFDFDIELLIKLVRKGFYPLELPVNYRSRSFKEGKKVR